MTSAELIALLQKLDPSGQQLVTLMAPEDGYKPVRNVWQHSLVLDAQRGALGPAKGEHMAAEDYRHTFPHGRKRAVPALVLIHVP